MSETTKIRLLIWACLEKGVKEGVGTEFPPGTNLITQPLTPCRELRANFGNIRKLFGK